MRKFVAFLLTVVMVLGLCSCLAEKSIVGTWKSQTTVLGVVTETEYTFNEDGTGKRSNVLAMDFTYSFTEDKKLVMKFSALGIETTEEYTYDFTGSKLVLTGDKETITLEKVK